MMEGNKRLQQRAKINLFFFLQEEQREKQTDGGKVFHLLLDYFCKVSRFALTSAPGRHVRHEVKFVLAQPELG